MEHPGLGMTLSPAYDLVNIALVNPDDDEEMALTLNGKKKKLKREHFVAAMNIMKVEEKQQQNIFSKMAKALPKWEEQIDRSFMSEAYKENFKTIIKERMHRIQR